MIAGESSNFEASFVAAVLRVCPRAHGDLLRAAIRDALPVATTLAIEFDATGAVSEPDFSFAMPSSGTFPEGLRTAPSLALLIDLLGLGADDGRVFFEIDTSAGSGTWHSFARLRTDLRPTGAFIAHLATTASDQYSALIGRIESLRTLRPSPLEFSDLGVVDRGGEMEVRLGTAPRAADFHELLAGLGAHDLLRESMRRLAPALVAYHRCTFQVGISVRTPKLAVKGVEIARPEDGWAPLVSKLVDNGWVSREIGEQSLAWSGREALPSRGLRRVMTREISHVKLSESGGKMRAKIYLVCSAPRLSFS